MPPDRPTPDSGSKRAALSRGLDALLPRVPDGTRRLNPPAERARKTPSSASTSRARAAPTEAERAKADAIISRLTPAPAVFESYLGNAAHYRSILVPGDGAVTAKLVPSKIFQGRRYLVIFTTDEWMDSHPLDLDAFAGPRVPFAKGSPPELIFARQRDRRPGYSRLRPILEHEFVHINQMMLGVAAKQPSEITPSSILEWYATTTQMEFEAYLVEYVTWPRLLPEHYTLAGDVERWSFQRAYTQVLEKLWTVFPENVVEELVPRLSHALRDARSANSVDASILECACNMLAEHAAIARRRARSHP